MIMWHLLGELCCAKKQVDMSLYVIYVYTAHMVDLFHGSPGEGGVSHSVLNALKEIVNTTL